MENQTQAPAQEQKPTRTVDHIRQEYSSLCAKAGHVQYQIFALQADLGLINNTLRDLNLEAASLAQKEQEASKVANISEAKEQK